MSEEENKLLLFLLGDSATPRTRKWTYSGGGGAVCGSSRDNPSTPSQPETTRVMVEVPKHLVGCIIGKGGSFIRKLKVQSGAYIRLIKTSTSTTHAVIDGSVEAVEKARGMILKFIQDNPHGRQPLSPNKRAGYPPRPIPIPIIKNFYIEDRQVAEMTPKQAADWRNINGNIIIYTINDEVPIPNPVITFDNCFSRYPGILENIKKQHFAYPYPIQSQAWPILMQGRDMMIIAEPGSGKALTYLLPALIHTNIQLIPQAERTGPTVLILVPDRERAFQIENEVLKFSYGGIKALAVCNGRCQLEQIEIYFQGVEIIIATPERLNDMIENYHLNMEGITYLVLDEADKLFDYKLQPKVERALVGIRRDRQTVMTSATWQSGTNWMAVRFLTNPVRIITGTFNVPNLNSVKQHIYILKQGDKYKRVEDFLLNIKDTNKVIVFCNKKSTAFWLCNKLTILHHNRLRLSILYGDQQMDRDEAILDMQFNNTNILIAAEIGDSQENQFANIKYVVNYDFPETITEYIYRLEITEGAGQSRNYISYMTKKDYSSSRKLIKILKETNQVVPDKLHAMAENLSIMQYYEKKHEGFKKWEPPK